MKKSAQKVFTSLLAAGALLTFLSVPSQASTATIPPSAVIASVTSQNALTYEVGPLATGASDSESRIQSVIRSCPSGYFGFDNFALLSDNLSNTRGLQLNAKNVWQSPSNDYTWEIFCNITESAGLMEIVDGTNFVVTPRFFTLNDGTLVGFRSDSRSGGYTIDITNSNVVYKVHLVR